MRDAEADIIGKYDFLDAERKARAKVHIVKVTLSRLSRHSRSRDASADTDPFNIWFEENFKVSAPKSNSGRGKTTIPEEVIENELVQGKDIITILTSLYDRDLAKLMTNYKAFESLDPYILEELGVSFSGVREGLKTKISGLKNLYWNELFNNLSKITDKLTKKSREAMLNKLTSRTDVDFNASNVYAVVIWVIKNANHYYSDQMIQLVERMVEQANIVLYKSNFKVFTAEHWRYCRRPEDLDCFSLETRVVLQRAGGLADTYWTHTREQYNGLSESAYWLIMDILTVATNLGFDNTDMTRPKDFEWVSNKSCEFMYHDYRSGETGTLMKVKAFKNGNTHIFFNSQFMVRLNTEYGRLKGWLKTAQEAASELDIPVDDAEQSFNSNLQLSTTNLLQLGLSQDA